ncbi:MAG: transposase [Bacteroidetes bacterium]|nr:transposase [Bacteroidota bacterium]
MLYATDRKLEIDNNLVENSIRPIAIGRKIICLPDHTYQLNAAMIYSCLEPAS